MKNDRKMLALTHFNHARDANGTPVSITWKELRETEHDIRGEPKDGLHRVVLDRAKDGDALMFAKLKKGTTRAKKNIQSVSAVGLDLDANSIDQLNDALEKVLKWEFWAYSTHKHLAECIHGQPRIRIVFPLSDRCSVRDAEATWRVLAATIGKIPTGPVDPQCCDASRLHYLPSTYDASRAWQMYNPGRLVVPSTPEEAPRAVTTRRVASDIIKIKQWLVRLPKTSDIKPWATALCAGKPFAEDGQRHEALLALTWALADRYTTQGLAEEHLNALFEPSVSQMDEPDLSEVWVAYEGAVERLTALKAEDDELKRAQQLQEAQRRQALAVGSSGPYSDAELDEIAETQGCTKNDLTNRWIVMKERAVFLLGPTGRYHGPYSREDATIAAHTILSRAPVRMLNVGTRGGTTYRAFNDFVRESGQVAEAIIASLSAQTTTFRADTGVLTEAVSPLRPLAPRYDAQIEEWLGILAGPEKEKLLNWVAIAPDLNKLLCAVYFGGDPGGGKSLFAHGMSKLWTDGGPSALDRVLGNFNDDLVRCPLVFADEKTTSNKWQQETITQDLREMISVRHRPLRRLYISTSSLNGCIRVLLAANNPYLLKSVGVTTAKDLNAIAERFLYIDVNKDAREYLETIPHHVKNQWGEQGIAEFALWARDNREVSQPEHRFWVEGSVGKMHHVLLASNKWTSYVCEWITRFLDSKNQAKSLVKTRQLVRIEDEDLLINTQAVIDGWEQFLPSQQRTDPNTTNINNALRALSFANVSRSLNHGRKKKYWKIDMSIVETWAESNQLGGDLKQAIATWDD